MSPFNESGSPTEAHHEFSHAMGINHIQAEGLNIKAATMGLVHNVEGIALQLLPLAGLYAAYKLMRRPYEKKSKRS